MNWEGVFPAITTPFQPDLAVDHGFLSGHVDWMIASGSRGIVALGSLGEGATLSFPEKLAVLETCARASRGRVPLVAGIAALSTAEAVELARAAREIGCAGLMALPPYVYRGDWRETEAHFRAVIEATPLSDRAQLEAKGFDLKRLARAVIQTFLRHALRDGFFHADMHPGNLFVDDAGELVAVDFGIMGRLGSKERRFLAEILLGFITRNYQRTAELHFEAGYVPRHHSVESFAQAIRAIGEPIHNRTAEEISMAKLFALLFEVTGLFDMRTRPELLLLQKTMVVVEGVARSLDPRLDMWAVAEPVVREWIERNLGPVGRIEDAAEGAIEVARVLAAVPGLLSRGALVAEQLDAITRDGLVLAPQTVADIGHAQARRNRWTAAALWTIALLLGWLIYLLIR